MLALKTKNNLIMESLVSYVQNEFLTKKDFPEFDSGDSITVYYQIREGEKVRTQFFKGTVIQIKGEGLSKTFTIRKMSGTVGVERIFPINLPTLEKIEVNKRVIRSENMNYKDIQRSKNTNRKISLARFCVRIHTHFGYCKK